MKETHGDARVGGLEEKEESDWGLKAVLRVDRAPRGNTWFHR